MAAIFGGTVSCLAEVFLPTSASPVNVVNAVITQTKTSALHAVTMHRSKLVKYSLIIDWHH